MSGARRAPRRAAVAAPALLACVLACARAAVAPAAGGAERPAAADTLRGEVQVTGSAEVARVVLAPVGRGGAAPVPLVGGQAGALRAVAGLEVMVAGAWAAADAGALPPGARSFEVTRFVVRAADGVPALDGVLAVEPEGRYVLRLDDGRRVPLPNVPAPLRERVGWRVFVAGPPDRAPAAYGLISAPR